MHLDERWLVARFVRAEQQALRLEKDHVRGATSVAGSYLQMRRRVSVIEVRTHARDIATGASNTDAVHDGV
jgi:hypothetical protein